MTRNDQIAHNARVIKLAAKLVRHHVIRPSLAV